MESLPPVIRISPSGPQATDDTLANAIVRTMRPVSASRIWHVGFFAT